MKRRNRVLVAGGISAALVAGSAAFAFANGVLASQPVDRVGTFQEIEARVSPAAPAPSTETTEPPAGDGDDLLPGGPGVASDGMARA